MYQTCPNCKSFNTSDATECYACGGPLSAQVIEFEPVAAGHSEPEWRREVSHRLEAYRERRRSIRPDASQNPFPFAEDEPEAGEDALARQSPEVAFLEAGHAPAGHRPRPQPASIAIHVEQPKLDFSAAEAEERPSAGLTPAGGVRERARAGLVDLALVALAFASLLAIQRGFAGELPLGKVPVLVYAVAFYLFYAQYFALFTFFAGATPGMHLRGLRVVSFEGEAPTSRQLLWRTFGYLLSGATLGLGFLWSLWDEDALTWQDRISKTCVVSAAESAEAGQPAAGE